jgi:hypothetical protein
VPVDDSFRGHNSGWVAGAGRRAVAEGRPVGLAVGFLPLRGRRGSGVRADRRPSPRAVAAGDAEQP